MHATVKHQSMHANCSRIDDAFRCAEHYFEDRTAFAVDSSVSSTGEAGGHIPRRQQQMWGGDRSQWGVVLPCCAGALVGLSLALAAVVGVVLLRRYEISPQMYGEAARSGNARAGGKVVLYAAPSCGALASSYDQASAAVETYLLLAGISYEKRLGSAGKAPRGRVCAAMLRSRAVSKDNDKGC